MIDDQTLLRVQYNWVVDIVKRMQVVLESENEDDSKLEQIAYLIKQALKAEKNND